MSWTWLEDNYNRARWHATGELAGQPHNRRTIKNKFSKCGSLARHQHTDVPVDNPLNKKTGRVTVRRKKKTNTQETKCETYNVAGSAHAGG